MAKCLEKSCGHAIFFINFKQVLYSSFQVTIRSKHFYLFDIFSGIILHSISEKHISIATTCLVRCNDKLISVFIVERRTAAGMTSAGKPQQVH